MALSLLAACSLIANAKPGIKLRSAKAFACDIFDYGSLEYSRGITKSYENPTAIRDSVSTEGTYLLNAIGEIFFIPQNSSTAVSDEETIEASAI